LPNVDALFFDYGDRLSWAQVNACIAEYTKMLFHWDRFNRVWMCFDLLKFKDIHWANFFAGATSIAFFPIDLNFDHLILVPDHTEFVRILNSFQHSLLTNGKQFWKREK